MDVKVKFKDKNSDIASFAIAATKHGRDIFVKHGLENSVGELNHDIIVDIRSDFKDYVTKEIFFSFSQSAEHYSFSVYRNIKDWANRRDGYYVISLFFPREKAIKADVHLLLTELAEVYWKYYIDKSLNEVEKEAKEMPFPFVRVLENEKYRLVDNGIAEKNIDFGIEKGLFKYKNETELAAFFQNSWRDPELRKYKMFYITKDRTSLTFKSGINIKEITSFALPNAAKNEITFKVIGEDKKIVENVKFTIKQNGNIQVRSAPSSTGKYSMKSISSKDTITIQISKDNYKIENISIPEEDLKKALKGGEYSITLHKKDRKQTYAPSRGNKIHKTETNRKSNEANSSSSNTNSTKITGEGEDKHNNSTDEDNKQTTFTNIEDNQRHSSDNYGREQPVGDDTFDKKETLYQITFKAVDKDGKEIKNVNFKITEGGKGGKGGKTETFTNEHTVEEISQKYSYTIKLDAEAYEDEMTILSGETLKTACQEGYYSISLEKKTVAKPFFTDLKEKLGGDKIAKILLPVLVIGICVMGGAIWWSYQTSEEDADAKNKKQNKIEDYKAQISKIGESITTATSTWEWNKKDYDKEQGSLQVLSGEITEDKLFASDSLSKNNLTSLVEDRKDKINSQAKVKIQRALNKYLKSTAFKLDEIDTLIIYKDALGVKGVDETKLKQYRQICVYVYVADSFLIKSDFKNISFEEKIYHIKDRANKKSIRSMFSTIKSRENLTTHQKAVLDVYYNIILNYTRHGKYKSLDNFLNTAPPLQREREPEIKEERKIFLNIRKFKFQLEKNKQDEKKIKDYLGKHKGLLGKEYLQKMYNDFKK